MSADAEGDGDVAALTARLRAALESSHRHADLMRRGRWLSTRCLVALADEQLLLDIREGRPEIVPAWPPLTAWTFALHGSAQAWACHWQSPPPAGWHDLLALAKRGELRIEGNLHPFMANLQYFKDLLALPRGAGAVAT